MLLRKAHVCVCALIRAVRVRGCTSALAEDGVDVWRVEAFQQQVAVIEMLRCVMVPSASPLLYIGHLTHCCSAVSKEQTVKAK
jgi:hypothetical protein